ncbi:F-box protein At4g35930-like isoform X1 [Musa acuminata AAA Group]|uniref:F-box protein At4g35930-like isoform X1 n=1 Tax=Musa acuminata AAA Group TaxID=214697 RepID=UPI0031E47B3D
MSVESMAFKQKKRVKNTKNKYLKPGALAQIRYSRSSSKSCTDIGKKRIVLQSEKAKIDLLNRDEVIQSDSPIVSPIRVSSHLAMDDAKQQKLPLTPKTPQSVDCDSQSRLESLPMDILVKILCHLHHDQLRAVFHVSQRIRTAVLLARQLHFNYTTPDRSRQEMLNTKTPVPTEHWPFVRYMTRWTHCSSSFLLISFLLFFSAYYILVDFQQGRWKEANPAHTESSKTRPSSSPSPDGHEADRSCPVPGVDTPSGANHATGSAEANL